jgi:hypothetical protein
MQRVRVDPVTRSAEKTKTDKLVQTWYKLLWHQLGVDFVPIIFKFIATQLRLVTVAWGSSRGNTGIHTNGVEWAPLLPLRVAAEDEAMNIGA